MKSLFQPEFNEKNYHQNCQITPNDSKKLASGTINGKRNFTTNQPHSSCSTKILYSQIVNQKERQSPLKSIQLSTLSENHHPSKNQRKILATSSFNLNKDKSSEKQNLNKHRNSQNTNSFQTHGKKSIQLIEVVQQNVNQNGTSMQMPKTYKFIINEKAVQKLLQIKTENRRSSHPQNNQFTFCTILGKTKTGKSFLLNQLMSAIKQKSECYSEIQRNQGSQFSVNHTLESGTKGIWLAQEMLKVRDDGKSSNLIFLDTQGSGGFNSTQEIDYKLMTLSILLTDLLLYNSIGPIDEQTLSGMSLAVEISKLIKSNKSDSTKSLDIISLPSLLWILRDFSLQLLTKDNEKISSNQYLENCLKIDEKKISDKNKFRSKQYIRTAIKSIFDKRMCSTLVIPFDEKGNKRFQFLQDLKALINKISQMTLISQSKASISKKNDLTKIQQFVYRLRAYVQVFNNQNSAGKNQLFPKIECFETILSKNRLIQQLKKVNKTYDLIFDKYTKTIEAMEKSIQNQQNYLEVIQQINLNLNKEMEQIKKYFNQKISSLICSEKIKNPKIKTPYQENIQLLFEDGNHDNSLIKIVKQNYLQHVKSIKQKKSWLDNKISEAIIAKKNQSKKQIKNENKQKLFEKQITLNKSYQVNFFDKIKQIDSVPELKLFYQDSVSEIQQFQTNQRKKFKEAEQKTSSILILSLLKKLEVQYLKRKVSLMQQLQIQQSASSFKSMSNLNNNSSHQQISFSSQNYHQCYNCSRSFYVPYIIIPSCQMLDLKIIKTIVKQIHQIPSNQFQIHDLNQKHETANRLFKHQFIIEVELNAKKWLIRRKLKDFIELNKIMSIMFTPEDISFHDIQKNTSNKFQSLRLSSQVISCLDENENKTKIKKELQNYLLQLNSLDHVRNSRIFQKFIKINKEYLDL